MCIVNDAIENGVGDRWLANHCMPLGDGKLSGDECRFALVALFKDLQQIESLLIAKRMCSPIIKDEQVCLCQSVGNPPCK